jgi:uncharacterized protein
MDIAHAFRNGSDGHKQIPEDWVSPTALRGLLLNDPALVWLQHHGAAHGFEKDSDAYSMLGWLAEQGAKFETEWGRRVAPGVVQANSADTDVRRLGVKSFMQTLECLARSKSGVVTKGALWHAPTGLYGTTDLLCRTSWLREHLPELQPLLEDEPEHWVVCDLKYKSGLDTPSKASSLKLDSTQVRLYSYVLGLLQNSMPRYAFLITRDRIMNPLAVEIGYKLGDSLNAETRELLSQYRKIKLEGADLRPWRDEIVRANPYNKKDEPWSQAKRTILAERIGHRSLHTIPYVGQKADQALRAAGYQCVDDLMAAGPDALRAARIPGLGKRRLARATAVLAANNPDASYSVSVPEDAVPPKRTTNIYVDFEYFPPIKADFENDWPDLKGKAMVFAVGCGWEEQGQWRYVRFVAADETPASERLMWERFIAFLRAKGIVFGSLTEATVDPGCDAALYHWSSAEQVQCRHAAARLNLPVLASLPLFDLQRPFRDTPIVLPGCWDFGLKTFATGLGAISDEYAVEYPEALKGGQAYSVWYFVG